MAETKSQLTIKVKAELDSLKGLTKELTTLTKTLENLHPAFTKGFQSANSVIQSTKLQVSSLSKELEQALVKIPKAMLSNTGKGWGWAANKAALESANKNFRSSLSIFDTANTSGGNQLASAGKYLNNIFVSIDKLKFKLKELESLNLAKMIADPQDLAIAQSHIAKMIDTTRSQLQSLQTPFKGLLDAKGTPISSNINGPVSTASSQIQKIKDEIIAAKRDLPAFKKALEEAKVAGDSAVYNKLKNSIRDLENVTRGGTNSINIFRGGFVGLKAAVSEFKSELKDTLFWQGKWYASKFLLFTPLQVTGQAIQAVAKDFTTWESATVKAGAVANMTADELEKLRKVTLAIGHDTPTSSSKAASAAMEFAQAGLSIKEISVALPIAAKMVVATNEDMSTSVEALTRVITAFNLKATEVPQVADMMTGAIQATQLKVSDLQTVFTYLGSTVAQLSKGKDSVQAIREMLTLISVISKSGVARASTIGTGLSNAIERLLKDETRKKIANSINLSERDLDPTKNSLLNVFKKLATADELTLKDIFEGWQIRGGRTVASIVQQGAAALDQMGEQISKPGLLEAVFGKASKNILDQFAKLKNTSLDVFKGLGESASPAIIAIINALQTVIDKLYECRKIILLIIETVAIGFGLQMVKHLGSVVVAVGSLTTAFTTLRTVLASISTTWKIAIVVGVALAINEAFKYLKSKEQGRAGDFLNNQSPKDLEQLRQGIEQIPGSATTYLSDWFSKESKPGGKITENMANFYYKGGRSMNKGQALEAIKRAMEANLVYAPGTGPGWDTSGVTDTTDKQKPGKDINKYNLKAYNEYNADSKKAYENLLKTIKIKEEERRDVLDQSNKLLLIGEREYNQQRLADIIETENKNIDAAVKYRAEAFANYNKAYAEIQAKYKQSKGKMSVEDRDKAVEGARSDLRNDLDMIQNNIDESVRRKQKGALESNTALRILDKDLATSRLKAEGDLQEQLSTNRINTIKWEVDEELKENDFLYSKKRILANTFYKAQFDQIKNETQLTKDQLDLQYNNFLDQMSLRAMLEGEDEKKSQEIAELITKTRIKYENDITNATQTELSKRAELLRKFRDDVNIIYNESGVLGIVKNSLTKMSEGFGTTAEQLDSLMTNLGQSMTQGLNDTFFNVVQGKFENLSDVFNDMLGSMLKSLVSFATNQIVISFLKYLFPSTMQSSIGLGAVMGLPVPGRAANGGSLGSNRLYLVGENGPELLQMGGTPGFVYSNSSSKQLMGGGSNVVVNVINQSSQKVSATQSQPKFDGKKMIVDVILKDLQSNGPIYRTLRSS